MTGVPPNIDVELAGLRDALARSEARAKALFDDNPLPMWIYDRQTFGFVVVNEAAIRHYGYSADEFAKMTLMDIRPSEDIAALKRDVEKAPRFDEGRLWRHRKKDGSIITVEIRAHEFSFEQRAVRLVLAHDVTERILAEEALRKTEEQLRQAQKMEAVGRLAGGVAHDFNNVLSVILSYSHMLLSDLPGDDRVRDDIEQIHKAANRAAELTRQLLLFSRRQAVEPKVIDLNETLRGMETMLGRLLGADIAFSVTYAGGAGHVRVHQGSIEQVVMNLVVNARDAMPNGGKLAIETTNVVLDAAGAREHLGTKPGPHMMMAVTDSGIGMDRETQARIFEPFFTTKEKGKGTGLGLSTAFGIVQQSGGSIWVYSELGKGTSFKVYLPRVDAPVEEPLAHRALVSRSGSETILLVDDDDQVRAVAVGILRRHGYDVIESRSGAEALSLAARRQGAIQLLIADVVMPGMNGPVLAETLRAARPELKVLCMSGYADDTVVLHGLLDQSIAYLEKPLTPDSLTRRVREVLDEDAASQPHTPRAP